jgi:hypothetical protein
MSESPQSNLNQIYNTETGKWSQGSPSPSGIRDGAAVATSGLNAPKRIYVLGVIWNLWEGEPPYSVRVYYPGNDSWTFGANIPTERHNFGVAILNDKLYAIGGQTFYYPDIQSWSTGPTVTSHATNEEYTPFGYEITDPSPSTTPLTEPDPFMTVLVATASGASVAIIGIGSLVYFKKRNH